MLFGGAGLFPGGGVLSGPPVRPAAHRAEKGADPRRGPGLPPQPARHVCPHLQRGLLRCGSGHPTRNELKDPPPDAVRAL